ncbi:hypothetical protein MNEG_10724 [Monoraphidium neglectum]|jgi:hypothetical protein|uniref:Uncharacterized protein n=1 Tax=Monoraphidium neglectum TaxID=145388 RepID=A0A0D2M808_9CHLO|nr:hypothetical protein MNEG_10724 [Monoraphidium neglectum]KIY97236.1 hypothetical protein MNEG_10724 [Monoraphidium neglectum]|eukprot:XP_013896256.1 hypothetical protein MNEG_10724 [Monoraphidium neglectum]
MLAWLGGSSKLKKRKQKPESNHQGAGVKRRHVDVMPLDTAAARWDRPAPPPHAPSQQVKADKEVAKAGSEIQNTAPTAALAAAAQLERPENQVASPAASFDLWMLGGPGAATSMAPTSAACLSAKTAPPAAATVAAERARRLAQEAAEASASASACAGAPSDEPRCEGIEEGQDKTPGGMASSPVAGAAHLKSGEGRRWEGISSFDLAFLGAS